MNHEVQFSSVHCSAVQFSSVHCSAVQLSSVQFSSLQCSSVQCIAVQFSSVHCSAVQLSSVQFSSVQCSSGQFSSIQFQMASKRSGKHSCAPPSLSDVCLYGYHNHTNRFYEQIMVVLRAQHVAPFNMEEKINSSLNSLN